MIMTENTEKVVETKKKEQIEFDVNLFTDYTGPRVYTDKRFPNGRIRIYLPAPEIDVEDDVNQKCLDLYNKLAQDLINAGIVQNAYGERDWANICMRGKTRFEITDDEILANIQKDDAIGPLDAENVEDRIRAFFEVAVFTEKKDRTPNTAKVVAKKLKTAGINDISDDEIQAIIAARKAKV
jgi:hypothetical protein